MSNSGLKWAGVNEDRVRRESDFVHFRVGRQRRSRSGRTNFGENNFETFRVSNHKSDLRYNDRQETTVRRPATKAATNVQRSVKVHLWFLFYYIFGSLNSEIWLLSIKKSNICLHVRFSKFHWCLICIFWKLWNKHKAVALTG
jgi:hypothetical protein